MSTTTTPTAEATTAPVIPTDTDPTPSGLPRPTLDTLCCEGRSPSITTGHHPQCDDDGWDHPGPCVIESAVQS